MSDPQTVHPILDACDTAATRVTLVPTTLGDSRKMSKVLAEQSFTAIGVGPAVSFADIRPALIDFATGTGVGTVTLERSTDDGRTWATARKPDFTNASWTNADVNVDFDIDAEGGGQFRFHCTAFTSGTIYTRIGRKTF